MSCVRCPVSGVRCPVSGFRFSLIHQHIFTGVPTGHIPTIRKVPTFLLLTNQRDNMFGTVHLFEPSCTQKKGYRNSAPGVLLWLQILQILPLGVLSCKERLKTVPKKGTILAPLGALFHPKKVKENTLRFTFKGTVEP